ncbi:MAG: hypothetical protein AAB295_05535, partial [Chloroflexota bacterium]
MRAWPVVLGLFAAVAQAWAQVMSPSPSPAARPRGVVLTYAPAGPFEYKFADLDRVERSFTTTRPPEVHTYHTDRKYRWRATARDSGLAVKIEVLSSVMQLDRTTAPKDLGGQVGEDLIDARGVVKQLGPVEDPIRPEAPLPDGPVTAGAAFAFEAPSASGHPGAMRHTVTVVGTRRVAGVPCVQLEIKSLSEGVDARRDVRVTYRQKAEVDFDPVRHIVVA